MTRVVFGYLRESNDEGMDEAGQRLDVTRLAERNGYVVADIEWVSDFGQSGRNLDRPGYVRMKSAIAEGRVAAVLARSVDRLGRDASDHQSFVALCNLHGTRVITERDGERTGDPDEVNVFQRWVPALVAEEESRLGRLRARKARETRTRNIAEHIASCSGNCSDPQRHYDGTVPYGVLPGEDLQAVLDAFMTAKGYSGAAKVLNALGVKPRRGQAWESTSVARVVKRNRSSLTVKLPRRKHRGSRTLATHTFARLLRCPHDQSLLTATKRSDRSGPAVGYFCRLGRTSTSHPRPWSVSERVILDWAKDMTSTLGLALQYNMSREEPNARALADAEEAKVRLGRAYADGTLPDDEYEDRLAALTESIADLTAATKTTRMLVSGKPLWRQDPDVVNARLHDLWAYVVLDRHMRPTGAVWREQPSIGQDEYGSHIPHPDAVRYDQGWYLPNSGIEVSRDEERPVLRVVGKVAS